MEWIWVVLALAVLLGVTIWPMTFGRRFFTPDARRRTQDVVRHMYAGPPGNPRTGQPFSDEDGPEQPDDMAANDTR